MRKFSTEKLFERAVRHGRGLVVFLSALISVENAHMVNECNWDAEREHSSLKVYKNITALPGETAPTISTSAE